MAESKMPARIWAHSSGGKCIVSFATPSLDYSVGYIRADLVEPLVEALRAMRVVMDRGDKPKKLDAALSWRECDEKARAMCDATLSSWEAAQ